jgi:uncharacterized OB-fold protein
MIETIPLPVTDDPVDAAFWQGCRDGRLLVQHCAACGQAQHPPRAMCPACGSMRLGWRPAAGTGTLWSFAVPAPPLLPAFAALVPYVTALVALDDHPGLRLTGALVGRAGDRIGGVDPAALRIGQAVRVRFLPLAEDVVLPCWTPAGPPSED